MKFTRRETLTLAAAATAAGVAGFPALAFAKEGDVIDPMKLMAPMAVPDKVIGDPNAKVTVIEYLSPTCPHCARVAQDVIGPFKDKYVATGKAKFIPRPFARNTLDVAIFLLAEAAARAADAQGSASSAPSSASSAPSSASSAPSDASSAAPPAAAADAGTAAWENVVNTYFRTQDTWEMSDKPLDALKAVATQLGFSDDSFNAALKDQDLFTKIQTMQQQALNDFGLEGTPTFYINGKTLSGEKTLDDLSKVIDPLL